MEKLIDAADIRDQIERVLEDVTVRGDHVIVEDHGEAVAVMVPIEFYREMLEQMVQDADRPPDEAVQTARLQH